MSVLTSVRARKTPRFFMQLRRQPYPLLGARAAFKIPTRLTWGLPRAAGRGLGGSQTVFSKGSWGKKTKFHARFTTLRGLHVIHLVVGFLPRASNLAFSVVLRSCLGGYILGLANQYHELFSFCQASPRSTLTAAVLWAQKSWWWPLALLAPHTNVSRVPLLRGRAYCAIAGGSSALFITGGLWGLWAFLLLPSGQPKFVLDSFYVSLGASHPLVVGRRSVILAGDARRHGQKPRVRGTVKNANDHPNGGRTRSLRLSQTPWAQPAKKSRRPRLNLRLKVLAKRRSEHPQQQVLEV